MSTTTKSIDMQQAFPMEIYFRIFKFIPASSTTSFAQTSKLFYSIASDSHSVSNTIEKFFGSRKQSLCRAVIFILNPQRSWNLDSILSDDTIPANKSASLSKALTAQVATILYSRGAVIPRYLTQLVVKDGGLFKPELFGWLVNTSIIQFGCDAKLHSDDHSSVTKIVMDASLSHWAREVSNAASEENTELISLRKLVVDYKYMPINCSSKSGNVSYFLFKLANMDMSLIDAMNSNGYDLKSLNDEVMKWVLRKQTGSPLKTLRMFLNHGFEMTPVVVGHGLQLSRPDILEALNELVQPQELQKFASDTVIDLLGPKRIYTTDGILDHIRESFGISDSIIETALLNVPKDSLFKTRPFNQQHPSTAWKWTLRHYGPTHKFTIASFDDVLRKLASGPASHCCLRTLPDQFFAVGVKFMPSQSKFIEHMALSEDMGTLAEHLFGMVKTQVSESDFKERVEWATVLKTIKVDYMKVFGDSLKVAVNLRRSKRLRSY